MNKYLISIVVPFFNEQEVVDSFYKRLTESINKCEKNDSEIKFELIFVDNGSTDNTFDILSNLNDESRNIKIIKLIRNFGIDGGPQSRIVSLSVRCNNFNSWRLARQS